MINRRNLLQGASALSILAAVPKLAEAGINHGSAAQSAPFGNINLGLASPSTSSNVMPFLNQWKLAASSMIFQVGAQKYTMNAPAGFLDGVNLPSAFGVCCDDDGELLTPLPAGTSQFAATLWNNQSIAIPPQFAGKSFTLDWTGGPSWTADIRNGGGTGVGSIVSGASGITFTFPTDVTVCFNIYVNFSAGSLSDPPKNIRFYKTTFQSRLNNGETVDPDYVASIAAGCGSFRCMDWMLTVNNGNTTGFATIPTETSNFWATRTGNPAVNGSTKLGVPLSVIAALAKKSGKNPYICFPANMISPKVCQILTVTVGNPGHIDTARASPFVNGDLVVLNSASGGPVGSRHFSPTSYASSTFTCSSPHGMVNGYPLRMGMNAGGNNTSGDGSPASGVAYPTGVLPTIGQYACNVTSTTFQIASTQANALAGANIVLSGPCTVPSGFAIDVFLDVNFNTYTVANATSTGFDLSGPGSDLTGYSAFSGGGALASPLDLTWITTQVGLIAGYFRDNLPANFVPVYEYSNEFWGSFTNCFFVLNCQSRPKFGDNYTHLGGYVQAAIFKALKDVYGGDRTRYKAMLGGNQAFGDGVQSILDGMQIYFNDNFPTMKPSDLFDYLMNNTYMTANYYPNGFVVLGQGNARITFGNSTISFTDATVNTPIGLTGMPVKLNTDGGGTTPSGLFAGTLGIGCVNANLTGTISGTSLTASSLTGHIQVGDTLVGAGVTPGTTVTADNGTSWTITPSQTVGPVSMKSIYPLTNNVNNNSDFPAGSISGTTLTAKVVNGIINAGHVVSSPSTALNTAIVGQLTYATADEGTFSGTISGNTLTVTSAIVGSINGGGLRLLKGAAPGTFVISGSGTTWTVSGAPQTISTPIAMAVGLGRQDGTYQVSISQSVAAEPMVTGPVFSPGTGTIYWLVGTGPNFGLAASPGGSPVAFTGGGATGTCAHCGTEVIQMLMDTSIANHNSSPGTYPTKYSYYNQAISDNVFDARWTGAHGIAPFGNYPFFCIKSQQEFFTYMYNTYLAPGKPLAGMSQSSYEGGDNNPPQVGFLLLNDSRFRDFYFQQEYSQGAGDNVTQNYNMVKALPGGYGRISQFLDVNPFGVSFLAGSYGAKLYLGDNNPRWQAVVAANAL